MNRPTRLIRAGHESQSAARLLYGERLLLLALACALALVPPAYAQQDEQESEPSVDSVEATDNATEAIDEVTVRGTRSLVAIERQIERADIAMYDIANNLIDDPMYQVRCQRETSAGTNIKKRVCRPGYERELSSEAWEDEKLMGRQGGNRYTFDYTLPEEELREHREVYRQKLIDLAAENPELANAIVTRAKLQRDYNEARQRRLGKE